MKLLRNKIRFKFKGLIPRSAYFTSKFDLSRKGEGPIFEIPVNSFFLPCAGTIMRLAPRMTRLIRNALSFEARLTGRPVVFLFHPNELIDEKVEIVKLKRRGKNFLSYLLGDKLRYHLKLKNLGKKSIPLLENQLRYLKSAGYQFVTVKEYFELFTCRKMDG